MDFLLFSEVLDDEEAHQAIPYSQHELVGWTTLLQGIPFQQCEHGDWTATEE
jgi:hypothetical protein